MQIKKILPGRRFVVVVALLILSCSYISSSKSTVEAAGKFSDPLVKRGMELYDKHCVACHGKTGLGDGEAEYLLSPKPRNFSGGSFRLTSTESGLPSESDLLSTLRMGMAGSSMPSWGHLPENDLKSLTAAIKHLAIEGKVSELLAADDGMQRKEALEIANSVFEAGPVVKVSSETETTSAELSNGKNLYAANCAKCHDEDGRGRNKTDMKDDEGNSIFSRDFTQGIFKGGSEGLDLARRIKRGMPGTPMPATPYSDDQLWSVVHYIQQFIKPGAQERVVQKQKLFVAARAAGEIQTNPGHPIWGGFQKTFVPVMPLWWRNDRIEGCELQAAHDGNKLAIRLVWEDATRNDSMLGQTEFSDGAAIQLSAAKDPPFFAMGAKKDAVNIWYWKAAWKKDIEHGYASLKAAYPNMPVENHNFGAPDSAVFQTGEHAGNPVSQKMHRFPVENLSAEGFGTLSTLSDADQKIDGKAYWENGMWHVLFVTDLKNASGLAPGKTISIALALWDGSAKDRNGQKSVTIWHNLKIQD